MFEKRVARQDRRAPSSRPRRGREPRAGRRPSRSAGFVPSGGRDGAVVSEESVGYRIADAPWDAGSPVVNVAAGLDGALEALEDAIDALDRVTLDVAGDRQVLAAVEHAERLASRLAAQQLRLLGAAHTRDAYVLDGAVTLASWLRGRTRMEHGEATRRVRAAVRLPGLPQLTEALRHGDITLAHATAVTSAAVPGRQAAIAAHEDTLVQLAYHAGPRELRIALRRIVEQADPDGTGDGDGGSGERCGPDARRELSVRSRFDGLGELHGWLDQLDTELLLTLLDALDEPDPADTPVEQRRSPAQRRADAFGRLLRLAADAGTAPSVHGVKPHLVLTVDLARLLGVDADDPLADQLADTLARLLSRTDADPEELARLLARAHGDGHKDEPNNDGEDHPDGDDTGAADARDHPDASGRPARPYRVDLSDLLHPDHAAQQWEARLSRTGRIGLDRARHLAHDDMAVTALLTLGPWRVVNVGRTMRTLPTWLRRALHAVHRHCRGPDCDRPAAWTDAHHIHFWDEGGDTDLNDSVPLCLAHHQLVTTGAWTVTLDPATGICTWNARDGTTRTTRPPPD